MQDLIWKLYRNKYIGYFFHSLMSTLTANLRDCDSVLDLGCGPNSSIRYCNVKYSVGVDAHLPYIISSKKLKIHNKYIHKQVSEIDFKKEKFDAVLLMDVIEHLTKKQGIDLLNKIEKWSKKKIIINTPNGYLPAYDSTNHYQSHKSGWSIREMKKRGYKAYGMAGWKYLRKSTAPDNVKNECFVTMKYKPGSLWFLIAGITQIFTFHFPQFAFEVFYIKEKK